MSIESQIRHFSGELENSAETPALTGDGSSVPKRIDALVMTMEKSFVNTLPPEQQDTVLEGTADLLGGIEKQHKGNWSRVNLRELKDDLTNPHGDKRTTPLTPFAQTLKAQGMRPQMAGRALITTAAEAIWLLQKDPALSGEDKNRPSPRAIHTGAQKTGSPQFLKGIGRGR